MELNGSFISFCGAGGTGKTTTAQRLIELLPGYRMLTGVSRSVFREKGVEREADQHAMTAEQRWDLQKAIQLKYLNVFFECDGQAVVSDRTHLCQMTYALQYCNTVLSDDDISWLESVALHSMRYVGVVFYFPLHRFSGLDDGMRESREGPRVMYDAILRGLLAKFCVPFIEVPVMSVDDRCQFIRERLPPWV